MLDAREVDHRADLRGRGGDRRADGQARVGREVGERDDDRRVAARPDVDPGAVVLAVEDVRRDSDDRAVDRRVDVGAGRRADVERGGRGAHAAVENVVAQAGRAAAEEVSRHAADEALVDLVADGIERERAVA